MINAGWLAVYGKEAQTDDTPTLAPVQPNETVQTTNVEVDGQRRPSRRRASRKPRCSARWKARANWSRTRNCARR